jgi:hypothetical protein
MASPANCRRIGDITGHGMPGFMLYQPRGEFDIGLISA